MQGRKLFCALLTGDNELLEDCTCSLFAAAQLKQGFRRGSKGGKTCENGSCLVTILLLQDDRSKVHW